MTTPSQPTRFPFLFGGTFIEADKQLVAFIARESKFPFLFGGTFIEAQNP